MLPLSLTLTDEEEQLDEKTQEGRRGGITWADVEPILRNGDAAAFVDLLGSRRHDIDDSIEVQRDSLSLCIVQSKAIRCLIGALRLGMHVEAHVHAYTPLFTVASSIFRSSSMPTAGRSDASRLKCEGGMDVGRSGWMHATDRLDQLTWFVYVLRYISTVDYLHTLVTAVSQLTVRHMTILVRCVRGALVSCRLSIPQSRSIDR